MVTRDVAMRQRPLAEQQRQVPAPGRRWRERHLLLDPGQAILTPDAAQLGSRQTLSARLAASIGFGESPQLEGQGSAAVALLARIGDALGAQHHVLALDGVADGPLQRRIRKLLQPPIVGIVVHAVAVAHQHQHHRVLTVAARQPGGCTGLDAVQIRHDGGRQLERDRSDWRALQVTAGVGLRACPQLERKGRPGAMRRDVELGL
jgi:hypothetical protein